MKKIFKCITTMLMVATMAGCGSNEESSMSGTTNQSESSSTSSESSSSSSSSEIVLPTNKTAKIYLAGDSTVKTYEDNQFIGGWGQYLQSYISSDVEVINCAQGGRSSRSFINEGRLYDIKDSGYSYTFTQNDGKSIEEDIKEGDFLFIQFGHNDDDTKKASSYSTLYDRMVPLGEKDENGNYPTTSGTKVSTNTLPAEYTQNVSSTSSALAEIKKYGSTYYSYDCGGTYKWYLKQYIDFAREKSAIPVLVTPVSRVKFDTDGKIVGGAGLHGENFAYVEAVRQLALEEDCLLIDLFAKTKTLLETATPTYANYLMALKPNDLVGTWPYTYDISYGNATLGYTGIEATHYNKYGAFLTAAAIADAIKDSIKQKEAHQSNTEYYTFADYVNENPTSYIDPSNLMSKVNVALLENTYENVNATNPLRIVNNPSEVVAKITALQAKGEVTAENYLEFETLCKEIRSSYDKLNIDDREAVTNLSVLTSYEDAVEVFIEAARPKPVSSINMDPAKFETKIYDKTVEQDGFKIVATSSKSVEVKALDTTFTYNGTSYTTTKYISLGGSASFNTGRYVEFTTTGKARVTVYAKSSGSTDRILNMVSSNSTSTTVASFDAKASATLTSRDVDAAGTYYLGSAGSGIYIYYIIIEYYA